MKPIEILSAIPQWAKATPEDILSSPAWAMPCRLGSKQCTMKLDAVRPAETLDLLVRFENEEHILGIAPSKAFPELYAVWQSRAEVPEPILLALVERDCGELLQLLENAVRLQLQVVGLAKSAPADDAKTVFAQVLSGDEPPISFALDLSPAVSAALGHLRNIDTSHQAIRETKLPAETEYAAFTIPMADLESLGSGDALLLPETETMPPRIIAAGKLALSETGVAEWKDEGLLRVCAAESGTVDLGTLFDAEPGGKTDSLPTIPRENAPLKLVRLGKTVATGRFGALAAKNAFLAD